MVCRKVQCRSWIFEDWGNEDRSDEYWCEKNGKKGIPEKER